MKAPKRKLQAEIYAKCRELQTLVERALNEGYLVKMQTVEGRHPNGSLHGRVTLVEKTEMFVPTATYTLFTEIEPTPAEDSNDS